MPINPAVLEIVLTGIAGLILGAADGDAAVARQAAAELLADYHPRTTAELNLAATIISCGFRSLETLVQAAPKDLPVAQMLRLHASAVSLSREGAKAQRLLAQLQKEQPAKIQPAPAEAPAPEPAPEPVQETTAARPLGPIAQFAKDRGITWSKAHQERERERRLAASIKRAEAKAAAADTSMQNPVAPGPVA